MSCCIGVRVGNSSACVAVSKKGKVSVVANTHGDRLTPCMITFTAAETLVGFASKQVSHRYISETVKQFNHTVGKSTLDCKVETINSKGHGATIEKQSDGTLVYVIKTNGVVSSYTPEHILELLLKNLLETAASLAGSGVNEAVFTVPIGCDPSYREGLLEAATNSGFDVLRIISEPAAAALAYGIGIENENSSSYNVLVFRVGGLTQDVTLFTIDNGILSVTKHASSHCGGDSFTDIIACHFASAFQKQFRIDITSSAKAMNKLRIHAEKCKHVLSTMPSASCHIDSLYDGMDFSCGISRSMFDMLAKNHLQRIVNPLQELLSQSDVNKAMIKRVILCGGTCNIPRLQQLVADILPAANILTNIPLSEVGAIGAATEAGLLVAQDNTELGDEHCVISMAPTNIYLKFDNRREVLVPKRTVLPCDIKRKYKYPEDQTQIVLELFIEHYCQDNVSSAVTLGTITMKLQDAGNEIYCELQYGRNGNISLTCTDSSGSKNITAHA